LAKDISEWKAGVEPLIGQTNIFVGPFGEVSRREIQEGNNLSMLALMFCMGCMDGYIRFLTLICDESR